MSEQTEGAEVEIRPEAQVYYGRTTLASALQSAKERIAEWDYDKDAHGYCHERPDWLRLVEAVEESATREAAAEARGAERALREAADAVERSEGPACHSARNCHASDALLLRIRAAQLAPSREESS